MADEAWAADKGRAWAEQADWLTRLFAALNDALADGAALQPGERVLDVGCGCGDSTLAAAAAVGPAGRVLGLDLSPEQLAVARRRADERGLANVEVRAGDAAVEDLAPGSFDVLISRLGVMFFDDPVAAFRHLHGALADGGRLAFLCWQDTNANPWVAVPAAALAEEIELGDLMPPEDQPSGSAFRNPDRVRSILDAAGFSAIRFDEVRCPVDLGDDADQALEFVTRIDTIRSALDAAPVDRATAARDRAREALADRRGPDGIRLDGLLWLVRART
jgi:SAM-dependent methyltransferase